MGYVSGPMVVALGRMVLAVLAVAGLAACGTADLPPQVLDQPPPTSAGAAPSLVAAQPSPPTIRVDVERGASAGQSGPGAYRYDVEVPQLVGVPLHGDALDAMIHGVLQRDLGAFLSAAQDAQAPTDLTCTSHTVRVTSKLAVLRVDCTSSQAGVARPTTVTHTFNCDLARARILTLQDVFGRGSTYLDVLTTAARSQFPTDATPTADQTVAQGTAPVADNFKAFLLDRTALVVVFAGFQVAPGSAAAPQVSISYEDLQRYLAPGISDLLTG